jgi:hypothetical protein
MDHAGCHQLNRVLTHNNPQNNVVKSGIQPYAEECVESFRTWAMRARANAKSQGWNDEQVEKAFQGRGCTHSRGMSDWLHGGLHSLPGGVRLVTWRVALTPGGYQIDYMEGCTHSRGVSDWLHGGLHSLPGRVSDWLHGQYRLSSTDVLTAK